MSADSEIEYSNVGYFDRQVMVMRIAGNTAKPNREFTLFTRLSEKMKLKIPTNGSLWILGTSWR